MSLRFSVFDWMGTRWKISPTVRMNPNLPTLEIPSELSPRSASAVCARVCDALLS